MSNCGRCGKPLENPKSIERGFGPICWIKLEIARKKEENKLLELLKGEREENDKPTLGYYLSQLSELHCLSCNADLHYGEIEHYEHNGGYPLKNYKNNQWIYITCPKCEIKNSLSKLMHFFSSNKPNLKINGRSD